VEPVSPPQSSSDLQSVQVFYGEDFLHLPMISHFPSFSAQQSLVSSDPPQSASILQKPQEFTVAVDAQVPFFGSVHFGSYFSQQYVVFFSTPPQSSSTVHPTHEFLGDSF